MLHAAIKDIMKAQLGQNRSTMKFALCLCLTSAAVLGVLAAKSKTEESQYYFAAPPKHGGDIETEAKPDDLGGELIEDDDTSENEDDAKAPQLPKNTPKKKTTTCTCPKTTPAEPTMSWEALEELLDVIRDLGPVSGTSRVQFEM